ncbi:hypothetical protein JHK87_016801 [Glycine soja]|nr:hypothetical protein JHK87_016801 [Glycine soja]
MATRFQLAAGKKKFKSKKGWKSIVPLHLKGKSATRFSLFRKVNSAGYGPGKTPVYLNVYDLTPMNGYVYWAGLGIYHSGVEEAVKPGTEDTLRNSHKRNVNQAVSAMAAALYVHKRITECSSFPTSNS